MLVDALLRLFTRINTQLQCHVRCIPSSLQAQRVVWCMDMPQRKKELFLQGDCYIALPGLCFLCRLVVCLLRLVPVLLH